MQKTIVDSFHRKMQRTFVHTENKCIASFELDLLTPRSDPLPSKSPSGKAPGLGLGPRQTQQHV